MLRRAPGRLPLKAVVENLSNLSGAQLQADGPTSQPPSFEALMSSHLASVGLAAALAFHEGELGLAASEAASPRRRRSHPSGVLK